MSSLKIGVCQLSSEKGDLEKNIQQHLQAIEAAAKEEVNYLVFPELSLTGYEPELAKHLAISKEDSRLKPLAQAAKAYQMVIGVGAPLAAINLPSIGLFLFDSDGAVQTYAKMNLHPGEDIFFSKGSNHHLFTLNQTVIANAICADTNNPTHCEHCAKHGAEIYIAGVLITAQGYHADTASLAAYASEHNIIVAMANHNRPTGTWFPIGKSAIWSPSGLLASADESENALVIAEKQEGNWAGYVVNF